MRKDKHITNVLFLLEKDSKEDVFAYFPNDIYDIENILRVSYSHIGQHSSCHPDYSKECNQASPEQYNHLKIELEGLGYALNVLNETTPTNTIQEQKEHFFWSGYTLMRDNKDKFSSTHVLELINPKSGDKEFIAKALNEYPKLIEVVKELSEICKGVKFMFGNEANYPEGTNGYRISKDIEIALNKSKEILP